MHQRIALVTGASSGIGREIVSSLKADKWEVIAPTRQKLDLSNPNAVVAYTDNLKEQTVCVDAFIHVAGIWHDDNEVLAGKKLSECSTEQITATMNVGIVSVMVMCAILKSIMKSSTVIGVSGTFSDGAAGWLPYYTSKRALEDFLVGLSQDEPSLRVFGISPADTATPAYQRFYPEYIADAQPPKVVADLVLRLLSDSHAYKSGDIIELRNGIVHGGFHS